MALSIVADQCEFAPDLSRGVIVIESDHGQPNFGKAFDELTGTVAGRNAAVQYATAKMGTVRLNGNTIGPYPVNEDGVPLDKVQSPDGKPLPQDHAKMKPFRYRADVPVVRPLS